MHKYGSSAHKPTINSEIASPVKTGVVGARGYSGIELSKLLLGHPAATLAAVSATDTAFSLSELVADPRAERVATVPIQQLATLARAGDLQTIFLATPTEVSAELAPELVEAGADVIDLSGAFRLNRNEYKKWYGFEHPKPEWLDRAEYGLVPFVGPAKSVKAPRLIANPGCYATAVLLAIKPLIAAGIVEPASLVIDAKSGASGAGRKASENLLFCEVEGDCLPYKVAAHQHLPEIARYAGLAEEPFFSTHLLPVNRGITAGIYARLRGGAELADVARAYDAAFGSYPLVRHGQASKHKALLSMKRVAGTAFSQIAYETEGTKLFVFASIDNLLKGAASQAVENFNRLRDLPVATGLLNEEDC
jgi:N-acetyl-gamma-glutamyl-phosphate reductase